jgi:hypothetical protein
MLLGYIRTTDGYVFVISLTSSFDVIISKLFSLQYIWLPFPMTTSSVGRDSNGSLIYASTKRFIGAEAKAAYSAISTSHSFLHGSLFFKAILV